MPGALKASENMDSFVCILLTGSHVDDLFRRNRRVGHSLPPAINVFVVLAGERQTEFAKQAVTSEPHRILDPTITELLLHGDLRERDIFVPVACGRQPEFMRTSEFRCYLDSLTVPADELLDSAAGLDRVSRVIRSEETHLQEVLFETNQINSNNRHDRH